jgi:hypothetical protein
MYENMWEIYFSDQSKELMGQDFWFKVCNAIVGIALHHRILLDIVFCFIPYERRAKKLHYFIRQSKDVRKNVKPVVLRLTLFVGGFCLVSCVLSLLLAIIRKNKN